MNRRLQTDSYPRLEPFALHAFALVLRPALAVFLFLLLSLPLSAKVTSSVASGNWNAPGTWNNGVPADGDQVTVSAGHTVTLVASVNFTLAGSSLTVNGTLNLGTFTCQVLTTTVAAGGTVVQNTTSGLPVPANLTAVTLTLSPTSTYSYTGNQTGFTGAHPMYGHLSYASSAAGPGTFEVNINTAGNLTINNSGAGEIRFANITNRTHTIGGNLSISAGNAVGSNGTANVAMDVNGDFTIANTASFKACNAGGNFTLNLAGSFTQNGALTSPGAGVFNIIFDGAANANVGGAAALSLPTLTLSKTGGAHVQMTQHLTFTKNLTFLSGNIRLGNFNLTQASGASVTGPSGATGYAETTGSGKYILVMSTPGGSFPIGNGSYTPMSMVLTSLQGTYGARVVNGFSAEIPGCNGFVDDDAVKKTWVVSREAGTANISEIYLNWNGSDEGSTFNRSLCAVVRYLGGDWESVVPNTATGSNPYQRGRVFGLASTVFEGIFGVLDNNGTVNLTAPSGVSNSPLCVGDTLNLQRTSVAVSGATYQWSRQGGGFNPPAGPNASLNNIQLGDAGNYLLTMSKYGCNYTSTAVPVVVNALPVCSIEGDEKVCANTQDHIYKAPPGLVSYAWTLSGNGVIDGPANSPQLKVDASAAGTYTVSLTVTDQNGCSATCSLEVAVLPRPTGELSGSTTICAGESAELSIAVTGNGPWSGTLSDGTQFSGAQSPILVTVTPATTTTYTLTTLNDENCTATPNDLSGSATVTIDVLEMFNVTGGGDYCDGGPGVEVGLSGSETGVSYQLYLNGFPFGDPVPGTGSAISFGLQTAVGTYTVLAIRNSTECEKQMMGSAEVDILPLPVVTLALGDNEALVTETNVPLTGGNPGGGTYGGPGVSGNSINPSQAGLGVHVVTYTVTDQNGCSNTATDEFTVSPAPGVNLLVETPDSAQCGEKFVVNVKSMSGFDSLGTLQFSLAWDMNLFMLMGTEPTVIDGSTPLTGMVSDTFIYSWLDENDVPYGVSLPDDTVLLRLTFKALACDQTGAFAFANSPRVIEASDDGLNVVPVVLLATNAIAIYDNQPPVFDTLPDITVQCSAVPDPVTASATDACDPEVTVVYEGQTTTPGNCAGNYTITRTWRATDDCDNTTTTAQVITVRDTQPPTFTEPADITISLNDSCTYNAPPGITGQISNAQDNCSPADSLRAEYFDNFDEGPGSSVIIVRTWIVYDDCGNSSSGQIQIITAVDNTPPTIDCPDDLSVVSSGQDCIYTITGTAFDPLVDDNCGVEEVNYTLGGAAQGSGSGSLNGLQLPIGNTVVTWTVTDINGLEASCSFIIRVQDCAGISGQLIWEGDDQSGVAQALVYLSGDASDTAGPTFPDGQYNFIAGASGNFVITPEKTSPPADALNGVSNADALAILQHLNNTVPITDPYKLIAGDVNISNSLTSTDASLIRQAMLGSPTAIEIFVNTPWRFVPTPDPGPGFPGYNPPANPFSAPIPESRVLTGVVGGAANQNFFGIKTGDVNATADPVLHPEDTDNLVWIVADQTLSAGQEVLAVFRALHFRQLAGYQFALRFDPAQLQFLGVETAGSPLDLTAADHFGAYQAHAGELRGAWTDPGGRTVDDGMAVFTLRFKALTSGAKLSEVLDLKPKALNPEAYTVQQAKTGLELVFSETTGVPDLLDGRRPALLQNRPNPFEGTTTIGFILPQACEAQLRVFDASGRELLRIDRAYPAGYSEETLRLHQVSGVLYYELTTPSGRLTRRMAAVQR